MSCPQCAPFVRALVHQDITEWEFAIELVRLFQGAWKRGNHFHLALYNAGP
jgi:hypothetical protein